MKQTITIVLLILTLGVSANKKQNFQKKSKAEIESVKVEELERQCHILNEKIIELDSIYRSDIVLLKSTRQEHFNTIESAYSFLKWFVSILSLVVVGFATYFGFSNKKSLNEYKKEMKEEAQTEIKKITNKFVSEVAQVIKRNPEALDDVIAEKLSDCLAKSNNSICLVHSDNSEMKSIKYQLVSYGFNNMTDKQFDSPDDINEKFLEAIQSNVIFFIDTTDHVKINNDKDSTELCNYLWSNKTVLKNRNYFYLGSAVFPFHKEQKYIVNYAKSKSTVYQNLLDLLRYIEYKKVQNI